VRFGSTGRRPSIATITRLTILSGVEVSGLAVGIEIVSNHLFYYLFIYLFLRNATFNMCKIYQYNQNLSGAIRHNSVLTTTPLKEKENNNKISYTSYFKCSDKSVLHTERLNAFTLLKRCLFVIFRAFCRI